jgi:hypothetical protein
VTCPSCGARNEEGSEWCERCLRRYDAVPPTKPNLATSKTAFLRTGSTTLTRQTARGPLVFVEPGGDVQATVLTQRTATGYGEGLGGALLAGDSLRHLDERHTAIDASDVPVFYVERYRAASEPSFAVFEPDGDALAVYRSGRPFIIRDGTGAPVARLEERKDRLELVETGGGAIAQCWRAPLDLGWMIDEQWGLTVLETPDALDRRALVALPLVCRLLWSSPPRRKPQDRSGASLGAGVFAPDLFGDLLGAVLSSWL